MKIVIIDYGSGNLRSAAKAFERAAGDASLSATIIVTADADTVVTADRIVLPGVGAFADCRAGIKEVPGLADALTEAIITRARPFFGICVGMQLMAEKGFENGEVEGFGWIPGAVRALEPSPEAGPAETGARIPHIGWNALHIEAAHPILRDLGSQPYAYFVHSYHLQCDDSAHLCATVDYGQKVTAAVGRDTMFGTQFHPEKSQSLGLSLITNFLRWSP